MAQRVKALPSGAQIGVYEIKDVISSDWSGILYHAWNEHLNTMVVLREYLPADYAVRKDDGSTVTAKSSEDASIYDFGLVKFLVLAEKLADIQLPHFVSVHNVLQFNGTAYLAMDLVDGTPLSQKLAYSLSFSESELKQILSSLLNGLQTIHDDNIFHGDINPSNIIIGKKGEPVLINFASANIAFSDHIKQSQQISSTNFNYHKSYHPEDHSSSSSDIYSLGASIFFCLTDREPSPFVNRKDALNKNTPDPCQTALEQIEPPLSEEFVKTILWMLNLSHEQRPQSAHEVLSKLDYDSDESGNQEGVNQKPNSGKTGAYGLLLSGLAGGLAALIAGGFWYYLQQTSEPITNRAGNNSEQIAGEERSLENIIPEQSPEDFDIATAALEFVEEKNEKTELKDTIMVDPQSSIKSVAILDSGEQNSDQLTNNQILEHSNVSKNQSAGIEENLAENMDSSSDEESLSVQSDMQEEGDVVSKQENSGIQHAIEQEEKINQYLLAAKKNVDALNLTTPPDNNAYDQYQAVLSIDKNNSQAIKGLKRIFNIYVVFIEKAIGKGDFNNAQVYIKRLEAIQPNTPEIRKLRKKLTNEKQQREGEFIQKGRDFVAINYL